MYPVRGNLDCIYIEIVDAFDADGSRKVVQFRTASLTYVREEQVIQAWYLDDGLMGWIDDDQPKIIEALLECLFTQTRDLRG